VAWGTVAVPTTYQRVARGLVFRVPTDQFSTVAAGMSIALRPRVIAPGMIDGMSADRDPMILQVIRQGRASVARRLSDDDWYVASIDEVQRSADDLKAAIDRTMDSLMEARVSRLAGVGLVDIVRGLVSRGGRETRLGPAHAFRKWDAAVTAYRAQAIRALVDEQHMTYTEIGELIGVSRQMVARLHQSAVPNPVI
jgi:hypothetical protein